MTSFLPIRVAKELRELFPWWAATVVGMVVCNNVSSHLPRGSGPLAAATVLIYVIGSVALGALSMGHEYSNRTLVALLAQPIDRRRILATKMAVLTPLLVILVPVAAFLFRDEHYPGLASTVWAMVSLPVIAGLSLAPWLTMVCRGALAGAVFATALPVVVLSFFFVVGDHNLQHAEISLVGLLVAALGAVMTWRAFMTLEAIDGPQAEIDLPGWLRGQSIAATAPTLARNPVWLLVRKELHLQQLALLISALFIAIWIGTLTLRRVVPGFQGPDLFSTAILHGWFAVVVTGALPSAEERQLGTIAWQSLMPMAAWRQWAIKAGVAMTLGFVLAVGLPMLLATIAPDGNNFPVDWELVLPVAMISASALYLSSLNSSGMRAILATFPIGAGAVLLGSVVLNPIGKAVARLFRPYASELTPFAFHTYTEFRHGSDGTSVVMLTLSAIGFVWLTLAFALANHRSADRPKLRIRWQVNWIILYALVATILFYLVSELLRAGLR